MDEHFSPFLVSISFLGHRKRTFKLLRFYFRIFSFNIKGEGGDQMCVFIVPCLVPMSERVEINRTSERRLRKMRIEVPCYLHLAFVMKTCNLVKREIAFSLQASSSSSQKDRGTKVSLNSSKCKALHHHNVQSVRIIHHPSY